MCDLVDVGENSPDRAGDDAKSSYVFATKEQASLFLRRAVWYLDRRRRRVRNRPVPDPSTFVESHVGPKTITSSHRLSPY